MVDELYEDANKKMEFFSLSYSQDIAYSAGFVIC
jgi:hypothetical protein